MKTLISAWCQLVIELVSVSSVTYIDTRLSLKTLRTGWPMQIRQIVSTRRLHRSTRVGMFHNRRTKTFSETQIGVPTNGPLLAFGILTEKGGPRRKTTSILSCLNQRAINPLNLGLEDCCNKSHLWRSRRLSKPTDLFSP